MVPAVMRIVAHAQVTVSRGTFVTMPHLLDELVPVQL